MTFNDLFINCLLGPISASFQINTNIKKSKGVDYYNILDVTVIMTIEDGIYYFSGLFEQNMNLGDIANTVKMTASMTILLF